MGEDQLIAGKIISHQIPQVFVSLSLEEKVREMVIFLSRGNNVLPVPFYRSGGGKVLQAVTV